MDIQIGYPAKLNLLWLLIGLIVLVLATGFYRRVTLNRFATKNLIAGLIPPTINRRLTMSSLISIVAMLLLIGALVDLRWGKAWRDVPQRGIEVIFVLDVSRSMLAEDVSPNRLERAKQQINEMVDEMAGDRVGLVVFAGEADQKTPLTRHYRDFKRTLSEVGTHDARRGGSRLGDALVLAADSFLTKTLDHKAIVVFTDGEDQESQPVRFAKQLFQEKGIRVFTVGLGDMDEGAQIPLNAEDARFRKYLQYEGETVTSRLNGEILKQVALATQGAYIPAGIKQVDMAAVYHQYIARVGQQDFESARINSYVPRFQYFVGAALVLLVIPIFVDWLWPASIRPN